jgi:hypothetical protein
VAKSLPDESVDFSVYSPPFASLYIYSADCQDMGNCANDAEFMEHYKFLIAEKYRITKPGCLSAVHCKNLVNYTNRDGMAGMRDFRGEIIRAHVELGWAYHCEITIWKDPVIEMQRTKAQGLLYKQLRQNSKYTRMGMAEYLMIFRKWGDPDQMKENPVSHARLFPAGPLAAMGKSGVDGREPNERLEQAGRPRGARRKASLPAATGRDRAGGGAVE